MFTPPLSSTSGSTEITNDDTVENPTDLDLRIASVSRSRLPGLVQGLFNSPTLRTLAITAVVGILATGIVLLMVHFQVLGALPRLKIAAVICGGIGLGALIGVGVQLPFNGKKKIEFEYSALSRLFNSKNYDEVFTSPTNKHHKIILGALPNRLTRDAERVVRDEGIVGFLSLNETREVNQANGLMQPYNNEDYSKIGSDIISRRMEVDDHTLLSDAELDDAADHIKEILEKGNVYVHCRAGRGRSAMAVAAYLIKYESFTVTEACREIKDHRDESTIWNKVGRLMGYEAGLIMRDDIRFKMKERLDELADYINDMPENERPSAHPLAYAAYRTKHTISNLKIIAEVLIKGTELDFEKIKEFIREYRECEHLMDSEVLFLIEGVLTKRKKERLDELADYVKSMSKDKRSSAHPLAHAAYLIKHEYKDVSDFLDNFHPDDKEAFSPVLEAYKALSTPF